MSDSLLEPDWTDVPEDDGAEPNDAAVEHLATPEDVGDDEDGS